MYGQVAESDTQRKKLIIVSAVMGLIILILAVILVNAIINKNKRLALEGTSEGTVSTSEEAGDNAEVSRAESAESAENSGSSENSELAAAGSSENSKTSEENSAESGNLTPVSNENDGILSAERSSETNSLPTTGPREAFSLALLLGSLVMFLSSKLYLKELA